MQRAPLRGLGVLWLCGLLLGLLTACATPSQTASPGEPDHWSGRLSLRVDSDPPQSFSAAFELRGKAETGELQLFSPLGQALASVQWSATGATLQQGNATSAHNSLDELTTRLTGTPLPVAALFGWIKGEPVNAHGWQADLARQPEGRITARREIPPPGAELRLIFQP